MESKQSQTPYPEELEAALEDVRQIRDVLDRMRSTSPIREIFRPLMLFGWWAAPMFVLYGVLCQQIQDAEVAPLGLSKGLWLGILTALLSVVGGLGKFFAARLEIRKNGYSYFGFISHLMLSKSYLQILTPILTATVVSMSFAIQAGQAHQIPGIILVMAGSVMMLLPLTLPLPELTSVGASSILLGVCSFFVLPAYPFYKVAILLGGYCVLMGWQGLRIKTEAHPTQAPERPLSSQSS